MDIFCSESYKVSRKQFRKDNLRGHACVEIKPRTRTGLTVSADHGWQKGDLIV